MASTSILNANELTQKAWPQTVFRIMLENMQLSTLMSEGNDMPIIIDRTLQGRPGDQVIFSVINQNTGIEKQICVALQEYGNVVTHTNKLRLTAFDDIDLSAARVVGLNMAQSVEAICKRHLECEQPEGKPGMGFRVIRV